MFVIAVDHIQRVAPDACPGRLDADHIHASFSSNMIIRIGRHMIRDAEGAWRVRLISHAATSSRSRYLLKRRGMVFLRCGRSDDRESLSVSSDPRGARDVGWCINGICRCPRRMRSSWMTRLEECPSSRWVPYIRKNSGRPGRFQRPWVLASDPDRPKTYPGYHDNGSVF